MTALALLAASVCVVGSTLVTLVLAVGAIFLAVSSLKDLPPRPDSASP